MLHFGSNCRSSKATASTPTAFARTCSKESFSSRKIPKAWPVAPTFRLTVMQATWACLAWTLRQGTGLGRRMMDTAENYFREAGCRAVNLRVISARTPLPAFYRHLGYRETGTAPFAPDVPVKVPCHYILMSKTLA